MDCTLWYHDHAIGQTRLNVYAGLAGAYIIRDDEEDALGLPSGEHEIALIIQDRSFAPDGSLTYPVSEFAGSWIIRDRGCRSSLVIRFL
jgi:spore coat protein A